MKYVSLVAGCLLISINLARHCAIASAQVIEDQTLPNNSIVTPQGDVLEITGGTSRGNNLFHSFSEFSALADQTVFFNNGLTVENILSRVTGSSISNIEGLIKANGTANLFLINPNGIIFGENAALDIGGSFIGSTADSIQFADGSQFSAVNPEVEPLLTISIPLGLQYGTNPQDITVLGTGNNLSIDFDTFTVNRSDRPTGLQVASGNTLALVGGNISLIGGNLTAPDGRIELGTVAEAGLVSLNQDDLGWNFNYEAVNNFQDISLTEAASIEVSGNGGGNVQLLGRAINIADGSAILADTLGDVSGEQLLITATESLEITGAAIDNYFPTRLSTDVDLGATGDGGDLIINSNYLLVADGAQINSGTFDLGDAGKLTVNAVEIEVIGESADGEFASGLFAQADFGETGNGGELNIFTDYLLVADGAQISTTTFNSANAGNLTIQATEIELLGASGEFSSGLFTSSEDSGNGGNLNIETDYLLVADGAEVSTTSFYSGNGGTLTVKAEEIELFSGSRGTGSSGLFASTEGIGNGGNIIVETNSLLVADGAQIAAFTASEGDAGSLNITANTIDAIATSPGGTPSGLFATVQPGGIGNGGELQITTNQLQVREGAQIAVSTLDGGNGGNLTVNARESVIINGSSDNGSSGLFANAISENGSGGNINLVTNLLQLEEGATISVSNFPSSENSTFEPGTGAAGNLNIVAEEINLTRQSIISADTFSGDRGNISLATKLLSMREASQISTNAQGTATGGNITIDARNGFIVATDFENNDITANAIFGDGGRVDITALDILGIEPRSAPTPLSDITASSEFGLAGNITLNTQDLQTETGVIELPFNFTSPPLAQGCTPGKANNSRFVNIGRGGLRPQGDRILDSKEILGDVQIPQQWNNAQAQSTESIVEAETWIINEQGNVMLVAQKKSNSLQSWCF
ncbi:filamentous hemagglutinin family N-terminal domain [Xenococcus sp. PCC 7305]|uniref:two-partner secretion domain-containing protein n=1 Tax=Xenococcus sp. PCC 7305 TaxID=102125 RepID=UPI0002AC56A2|nr:S-layer family protein [Xenococcus sp. PCC 7305]ELS00589.1 filamentous hemagglutinin family N-terminal domain [Xenococcus sp. PCC 7305]